MAYHINGNGDDIIDLTDSFTLADHCALTNFVIDLDTDESYIEGNTTLQEVHSWSDTVTHPIHGRHVQPHTLVSGKKKIAKANKSLTPNTQEPNRLGKRNKYETCNKFGDCPICWDELGNNPLASTKCGHVYCLKCLEQSLHIEKRCPTCRQVLKGSSAYHPLYLARH